MYTFAPDYKTPPAITFRPLICFSCLVYLCYTIQSAPMERQGKLIIFIGILVVLAGGIVWLFGDKLRFIGRLPGDIRIDSGNMKVFIPITTMLLASALLTLISWVVQKFIR